MNATTTIFDSLGLHELGKQLLKARVAADEAEAAARDARVRANELEAAMKQRLIQGEYQRGRPAAHVIAGHVFLIRDAYEDVCLEVMPLAE